MQRSGRMPFSCLLPATLYCCCLQAVGRDAEIGEEAIKDFVAAQFAAVAGTGGNGDGGAQ